MLSAIGDVHHQPFLAAVLGDEGHARARWRGAASCRVTGLPPMTSSPLIEAVEAEEDARELGAARAHQAEEADDLARAQR